MALTQVSTGGVKDGTILNADLNASASIAGTKISPSFGSQNISTTGTTSIGGATSVGTKLHIENSSGDAHIRLRGSANYGILFTRHSDGALTGYVGSGNAVNLGSSDIALSASLSGGSIKFQTNGTAATDEKMRIQNDGKIGVNTTAPSELFTINGADQSALIRTSNAVGTAKLKFEADGTNYAGVGLENTSLVFRCSNSSTPDIRFTMFADGSITSNGDIRVDRGVTGVDGILGQAYSGYFGLKHTDQTINQEYMIISDDSHTFISASNGAGVYIRPDANSVTHETFFGIDTTYYKTNIHISDQHSLFLGASNDLQILHNATGSRNEIISSNHDFLLLSNDKITFQLFASGNTNNQEITRITNNELINFRNIRLGSGMRLTRSTHESGHLEGGYNNLGSSDLKSNPIFTIGSNYNPAETTLSNMYGVGFCTQGASFINPYVTPNWGMYVASDGDARIFLGGSDGRIFANGAYCRTSHQTGHLEGGQNNIGTTDAKTSPIYTIGSSYNPAETTLSDMYGIGFSHGNASFTPSGTAWGMYVASDGNARIFLDAGYGNIHFHDGAQGSVVFSNGSWSGDKSTGKIQTYAGHLYMQNASNSGAFAFRLPNGTEPYKINANGTVTTSDRRLKKDITTITGAVDTVKQLIGRSFTWKEGDTKSFGIIAQEVETILPEIISTQTVIEGEENDDPYKMVNYAAFTGHFIEAIKELATKIEALETEVATLKAS